MEAMNLRGQTESIALKRKVFIVDDHPILRQGITQLINQERDLMVGWESETAREALAALAKAKPDIMVVDISLKNSDGIELIKNIRATYPALPVLVLSMHEESLYAERALRAGAGGYIMKQEATGKVLTAIRSVLKGELYISEKIKEKLVRHQVGGQGGKARSPVEQLSDRELEVFGLLGRGRGTSQIAEQLHLSTKTVETYRANIMEKLDLHGATELVQRAFHWVHSEKSPG
jgi:DNA-binding NarL/FixJ family response regulator